MDLDLVHIHGVGTDGGCHLNALALSASGIGGHEALQLRLVLGDHVQVCAETASGQHNGLGIDGDGLTGSTGSLHAHSSAVGVGQDLGSGGVQQSLHTSLVAVLLQQRNHVRANGNGLAVAVHGAVDALDGCAAEAGHAVQSDAVLVQPVDGVGTVGAQSLHQLRVIQTLAADHGVQLHQLHAVEVALGVSLISCPLLRNGLGQGGDGSVVGVLFSSSLQGLFHAGGLAELVLVLVHGVAGVHAAGGTDGVAAHHGLALQDDNALALSSSGDGSSHACAACAHDGNICVNGGVLCLGGVGLDSGLVVVSVQTSCNQSGGSSLLDGIGGDGSTGDAVHSDAAGLSDLAGQLLQSQGTNALGLVGTLSGAAGDLAVSQGQGDGHVAAHALCGAGKVTGDTCSRGGGVALCAAAEQAQGHDGCQCKRSNAFSHDWIFLPSSWWLLHGLPMRTSISIKRGAAHSERSSPLPN